MLSIIIIAKNEARHIQRCLASVQWADEIIVLDSGSTDDTIAIAQSFTPHVYSTDWPGYGAQKQRALLKATGHWVLNLDADESVSGSLKEDIIKVMLADRCDAYRIPIRLCFYDRILRFSGSPTRHVRLFKREGAEFSTDIVHEKIILPHHTRIGRLKSPILHHSYRDLSHAIEKMNRYSSYSAKIRIEKKKRFSFIKTLCGAFWMFFRCYFLQGGLWEGKMGYLLAVLQAQTSFYRGMKQIYQDQAIKTLPPVD